MISSSPEQLQEDIDYEESMDVQDLHTARYKERSRLVTVKPFPIWALIVCGLAIFFGGFWWSHYVSHSADATRDLGNRLQSEQHLKTDLAHDNPAAAVPNSFVDANAPTVVQVVIRNMKFNPATLEVKVGDVVEWKNDDITPHTATAGSLFDSGSIDSDKSWRHTFTNAGNFPYTCIFHPEMKAVVTVK